MKHAHNHDSQGYEIKTLCGLVYAEWYEPGLPPDMANGGQLVTCEDCRAVIRYINENFACLRYLPR